MAKGNHRIIGSCHSQVVAQTNCAHATILLKANAQVEITAKVFHGYNAGAAYADIDEKALKETVGR